MKSCHVFTKFIDVYATTCRYSTSNYSRRDNFWQTCRRSMIVLIFGARIRNYNLGELIPRDRTLDDRSLMFEVKRCGRDDDVEKRVYGNGIQGYRRVLQSGREKFLVETVIKGNKVKKL